MVHAIKLNWKLGCGCSKERSSTKWHVLVEAGYVVGSLLFTIGTLFFFPIEGLENFVVGCRLFEVGSVIFAVLTGYAEVDRWCARRAGEGSITKRELLEQLFYFWGSFVFLVGTFLFDPPVVEALSRAFDVSRPAVENWGAVLFMVGSFFFSLGAYVSALSIFEAPRMFRRHLVIVTSSYMFGGLLFIAGTMGYVAAFEPNFLLRFVATWFYLIGCLFYVNGTFLSFVHVVARRQVKWERIQDQDIEKKRILARISSRISSAVPRVLKARASKTKQGHLSTQVQPLQDIVTRSTISETGFDSSGLEKGIEDVVLDEMDLDVVQNEVSEQIAAVLGADMSRDLLAVVRDGEAIDNEDLFGAFWRSVKGGAPFSSSEESLPKTSRIDVVNDHAACTPDNRIVGLPEKGVA